MSKFSSFKESQLLFENWRMYSENCGCPDKESPVGIAVIPEHDEETDIIEYVKSNFEDHMTMEDFAEAFENFEVKFNFEYPESLFELHRALDSGLADTLRSLYDEEFESPRYKQWLEGDEEAISDLYEQQEEDKVNLVAQLGAIRSMINNPEAKVAIDQLLAQMQIDEKKK